MSGERPSYKTISNFIEKYFIDSFDEVFDLINAEILRECKINAEQIFIDGTKIEGNSNKYKFVWKPITFHLKLNAKIQGKLFALGLLEVEDEEFFITSSELQSYLEILEKNRLSSS